MVTVIVVLKATIVLVLHLECRVKPQPLHNILIYGGFST